MTVSPRIIILLLFLVCVALPAKTQVPLTQTPTPKPDEAAQLSWQLRAAESALYAGFPIIAERLFLELQSQPLSTPNRERVLLGLVDALIAQQKLEMAQKQLQSIQPESRSSGWRLRAALIAFYHGQQALARRELEQVVAQKLSPYDKPWQLVLQGLLSERAGEYEVAENFYQSAREIAVNNAQRTSFESIILRNRILAGQASDDLLIELKQKVKENEGRSIGFQFAREYAVVLFQMDRSDEALEVLERHLRLVPSDQPDESNEIRMLEALIADASSPRGRAALRAVLRNPVDRTRQRSTLYLLAANSEASEDFRAFLAQLIEEKTHPIEDDLLLLQSRLALEAKDFSVAEKSAKALRERYPGSQLREEATRLLAYLARERKQYRIASDYLNELREDMPEGQEKNWLSRLVADAYFLNGDYTNASQAYGALLPKVDRKDKGEILQMRIHSDIRAGEFELAVSHIDAAYELNLPSEAIWKAEWILLQALRKAGQVDKALERIATILDEALSSLNLKDKALLMRLRWMQAQLSLEAGDFEEAIRLSNALLTDITSNAEDFSLSIELREAIESQLLLLIGQAQIAMENVQQALEAFAELRTKYPQNKSTAHSYLIEARHYSANNQTVDAQRQLQKLAENFKNTSYAPIALFEAAKNAEARGVEASLVEANDILNLLINNYSDDPLVFYARLKQGDLARQLNDFGTAQSLYELLLQNYPNHPEHYRVNLALADTLLARASRSAEQAAPALAAYERLFDMPALPADARAEAGFKWGYLLAEIGSTKRAQEVYWLVIDRCLESSEAVNLQEQGRYWVSRCAFELGTLFEGAKEAEKARELYTLIINNQLPGSALAQARLSQLGGAIN